MTIHPDALARQKMLKESEETKQREERPENREESDLLTKRTPPQ